MHGNFAVARVPFSEQLLEREGSGFNLKLTHYQRSALSLAVITHKTLKDRAEPWMAEAREYPGEPARLDP